MQGEKLHRKFCVGIFWPTLHKNAKEYCQSAMYAKVWESNIGGTQCI
jgi:hypothetical protein